MTAKIRTGTDDRPESIARTDKGPPDDGSSIVEVDSEGTATVRKDLDKRPAKPSPPEDADFDAMDQSPARRKDRARDTPTGEAGPNDDTYD